MRAVLPVLPTQLLPDGSSFRHGSASPSKANRRSRAKERQVALPASPLGSGPTYTPIYTPKDRDRPAHANTRRHPSSVKILLRGVI
jgi:hypothetical protein